MRTRFLFCLIAALACADAQPMPAPKPPSPRDETRVQWTRNNERFIRRWLMLNDIPLAAGPEAFAKDEIGEATVRPADKAAQKTSSGATLNWRQVTSWTDSADFSDGNGLKRDVAGYAFATVNREQAGKALLCIGSDESVRVWVNGALVLDRRTPRQLTFDEDQVEVDMKAGDNALLLKVEQRTGAWTFAARVLERGAIAPRLQEIGPSLIDASQSGIAVLTDISKDRAAQDKVVVQVAAAGGKIVAEKTAPRGDTVRFDPVAWPEGAYEVRCSTHRLNGLLYATHLPWYKGDAVAAAARLVDAGSKADLKTTTGFTTKMLADMVLDRLGKDGLKVTGNPWWAIHAPLMEYAEMQIEAAGKTAMARSYGFVRLAYRDEIDGSPQYCRAYLPGGYDRAKKWPLVIQIHGYNPANPDYVRWWAADVRHYPVTDSEFSGHQGIIYMEPHGRGNTTYLGLGDQDVVRVIQLAKQRFNVDEDRVYLRGDSMGGWGTWNVSTRHPDLFAAIAPIFGGVDYHSTRTEEELAKLTPNERFVEDKTSSWSMGESLLHMPILVHHGDVDQSVNVDFSRYGVRLLQRWGYDVRYVEMPGYGHEDLGVMNNIIEWFLLHRRDPNPRTVRLRSAELQNASVYWVKADQAASPKDFMVVDAEAVDPNTIRVDSQNVLALTLSPSAALADLSKDVKVVWNGDARMVKAEGGKLILRAADYRPSSLEKNSKVAGPLGDIFNTPFLIVTGTASSDPAMNEVCRKKSDELVEFWKQWQRQPARVVKDSELSDTDAARYSLLLIGGPDANSIARKFAGKLPLEVKPDAVRIGGKSFAVKDARVQMIYPSPLNPQRYVFIVTATSADGMFFWSPGNIRNAEYDFGIEDGHVAGGRRTSPSKLWVAGGWFNRNWQVEDGLVIPGDAEARANSMVLRAPKPGLTIPAAVLDSYAGDYQIESGPVIKIRRDGARLTGQVTGQSPFELLPVAETEFFVADGPTQVVFQKDASGKVTSMRGVQGGRPFIGKKQE